MNKLSSNLKNLINAANLSENELARRTGIPQQVINRILRRQNENPKLATLLPLAKYFMVSISDLIGDDINLSNKKVNVRHLGWTKIPLLEWNEVKQFSLTNDQIVRHKESTFTDAPVTNRAFAVKMIDDSMRLKFEKNSLLVFDADKKPRNKEFSLFCTMLNGEVLLRQFFYKNDEIYTKCLNPKLECYKISLINDEIYYLGTLIQSRLNYFNK